MAKKKTVLLVESPFYAFFQYDQWNYSYSCAYYAAVVKNNGNQAFVYDADKYFEKDIATLNRMTMVERQSLAQKKLHDETSHIWQHYCTTLLDINPEVVMFSTWTFKLTSIDKAIELTKQILPGVKIAVGGYHATALPEKYVGNTLIDAVFIGPSEDSLVQWLDAECPKHVYDTPVTKKTFALDVHPDRKSFLYPESFLDKDFNMSILSRGCHSNCAFCQNKQLSRQRHIYASEAYIRKELEIITQDFNNSYAVFADAHFFDSKQVYDVLKIIKEYNVTWACALRIDAISPQLLEAMQEAGCIQIFTGIERGSNTALRAINKKLTVEQTFQAGEMIKATALVWRASFIIGFPDETYESIEDTKNMALNLGCHYISLNSLTPLPGTLIWDSLTADRSPEFLLRGYNQLNPIADFINSIPSHEYEEAFKRTLATFEHYNDTMKHRTFLRDK